LGGVGVSTESGIPDFGMKKGFIRLKRFTITLQKKY
jgi:NAD-dependent SIR2 family protein deacetylase